MKALHAMAPLGFAAALTVACSSPEPSEPIELETVEVDAAIDADLSTEGDLQAVRRPPEIAGVLPGGVPPDLPLFIPSSVVDFGDLAGGRAYVELDAGATPDRVRAWLGERLPAAGWTVSSIGGDGLTARKGEHEVAYRLSDLSPGTRIRLEYPPRADPARAGVL